MKLFNVLDNAPLHRKHLSQFIFVLCLILINALEVIRIDNGLVAATRRWSESGSLRRHVAKANSATFKSGPLGLQTRPAGTCVQLKQR